MVETVPEAVATEMVVTTSNSKQWKPLHAQSVKESPGKYSSPLYESSDAVLQDVSYEQTPVVWASLLDGKLHR